MMVATATCVERIAACRARIATWRQANETICLVPTMGALHAGHLSLIQLAQQKANRVVVSIFVNPTQFTEAADFEKYPRVLEDDLKQCDALGVDLVFAPSAEEMYPTESETTLVVPSKSLTEQFCGLDRPGHFTGVATVVLKLFNIVQPHCAVFGEKDAQQLAVINHMVSDLNLPVTIIPHPIVRDADGLALSSRNRHLNTPEKRRVALVLNQTLNRVREKVLKAQNEQPLEKQATLNSALEEALCNVDDLRAQFTLDYLDAVDPQAFNPVEKLSPGQRLLMAARVGDVRLIDNITI